MSRPRPSRTRARSKASFFSSDLSGTTSKIDNEGTIAGSGFVISSDSLTFSTSTTQEQFTAGSNSVEPARRRREFRALARWHRVRRRRVFADGAGNSLTNAQAGTITGSISIGGSGDTINNAGGIDGAITLLAGERHVHQHGRDRRGCHVHRHGRYEHVDELWRDRGQRDPMCRKRHDDTADQHGRPSTAIRHTVGASDATLTTAAAKSLG